MSAQPNTAHLALADLEKKERLLGIVTQNFDGLHHDAGNNPKHIVELHGTSRAAACTHCGQRSSIKELQQRIDAGEIDPLCPDCGGFLKAATILFGQRVPDEELSRARELALACDLFLVVGSSLKVNPAATLPRFALKNTFPFIIINLQPTHLDDYAEIVINEKAGVVLPPLVASCDVASEVSYIAVSSISEVPRARSTHLTFSLNFISPALNRHLEAVFNTEPADKPIYHYMRMTGYRRN